MSVTEIYERQIRTLPASDRLRLASMILNDIPPQAVADYSDQWSEEDLREFAQQGWQRPDAEEGAKHG